MPPAPDGVPPLIQGIMVAQADNGIDLTDAFPNRGTEFVLDTTYAFDLSDPDARRQYNNLTPLEQREIVLHGLVVPADINNPIDELAMDLGLNPALLGIETDGGFFRTTGPVAAGSIVLVDDNAQAIPTPSAAVARRRPPGRRSRPPPPRRGRLTSGPGLRPEESATRGHARCSAADRRRSAAFSRAVRGEGLPTRRARHRTRKEEREPARMADPRRGRHPTSSCATRSGPHAAVPPTTRSGPGRWHPHADFQGGTSPQLRDGPAKPAGRLTGSGRRRQDPTPGASPRWTPSAQAHGSLPRSGAR